MAIAFVASTTDAQHGKPPATEGVATTADRQSLVDISKRLAPGIVVIGRPGTDWTLGTAFVISKKARLVATAAHVADIVAQQGQSWAVVNGTVQRYTVSKVWYHPATLRQLDDGLLLRTPDPRMGPVSKSPDVAVLRLAEGGPDLTAEWPLAAPAELRRRRGDAIGLMGYFGEKDWRDLRTPLSATFLLAEVDGMMSFDRSFVDPPETRGLVIYQPGAGDGGSGGPVFLPNGNVIAIASIGWFIGSRVNAGAGTRVDYLRELIHYHGLEHLIPSEVAGGPITLPPKPEPESTDVVERYQRACSHVRDAREACSRLDFRRAAESCSEAIRLVPKYRGAFVQRAKVYLQYLECQGAQFPPNDRSRITEWAANDRLAAVGLARDFPIEHVILYRNCWLERLIGRYTREESAEFVNYLNEYLASGRFLSANQRSSCIILRARAETLQGKWNEALSDFNEAIRLDPDQPRWYMCRALYWEKRGRPDLASKDRAAAAALRSAPKAREPANPSGVAKPAPDKPRAYRINRASSPLA